MSITAQRFNKPVNAHLFDAFALRAMKRAKARFTEIFEAGRPKLHTDRFEYGEMGGFGLLSKKAPLEGVTFASPSDGWSIRQEYETWAIALLFAKELMEDQKVAFIGSVVQQAVEAGPQTQEYLAARMFNNGTATTYHTTNDGLAIFSDSHRIVPAGPATYDNLGTPAVLSSASLEAELTNFRTRTDEHGLVLDEEARFLVHHPKNDWKVKELLLSTQSPEDDRNAINPAKGEHLTPISWPQLTNQDSWFLLGPKEKHGLRFILRVPIATQNSSDIRMGGAMIYVVRGRWCFVCLHPRHILGVYPGT